MRLLIACAALLLAAAPAGAQRVWNGGFAAAGVAQADDELVEDGFSFVFGWDTRWAIADDFRLGIRGLADYSRLEPDEEAILDELGLGGGDVEGGATTVVGTGFDFLGGYQAGDFGGYGWVGMRFVRDERNDAEVESGGGVLRLPSEGRSDLGASYGAGVSWSFGRAGVLAEWFHVGGFDDRMVQVDGLRLGVMWSW
jgi:hypothetical protein